MGAGRQAQADEEAVKIPDAAKELLALFAILAALACCSAFLYYMVTHYRVTPVEGVIYDKGVGR